MNKIIKESKTQTVYNLISEFFDTQIYSDDYTITELPNPPYEYGDQVILSMAFKGVVPLAITLYIIDTEGKQYRIGLVTPEILYGMMADNPDILKEIRDGEITEPIGIPETVVDLNHMRSEGMSIQGFGISVEPSFGGKLSTVLSLEINRVYIKVDETDGGE